MSTSRPSLVPGAEETRLVQTLFFNEVYCKWWTCKSWERGCTRTFWSGDKTVPGYVTGVSPITTERSLQSPQLDWSTHMGGGPEEPTLWGLTANCSTAEGAQACTPTVASFSTRMSVGSPVQDYLSAHTTSNETIFLRPTQSHPLCGTCFRRYQPSYNTDVVYDKYQFQTTPHDVAVM